MYRVNKIANTHQPCPDCSVTLCRCSNCHTIHCDSERLCNYPISEWRPKMDGSVDEINHSIIYRDPIEKHVDYKSTRESGLDMKEPSVMDE